VQNVTVPDANALLLFSAAALALLLIPGPAVLYVVVQSAEHGRLAGLASVGGLHLGTLVHTAAAAIGLSALVVSSALAFSVVKYAGAGYLIFLGIRRFLARDPAPHVPARAEPLGRLFRQGVVVNVLNPKTAVFFLAFLPQFVDPDGTVWTQVIVFGLTFVALGLVTDSAYAVVAGSLGPWMRRRRRALRYASGGVFVGLGTLTALAKRS
jgi:threonine/homoserine/homoserine lactone efflux protein